MHTGMLLWLVWQTVSVTRMKHMHVAFRGRGAFPERISSPCVLAGSFIQQLQKEHSVS